MTQKEQVLSFIDSIYNHFLPEPKYNDNRQPVYDENEIAIVKDTLHNFFRAGYCYYFATILKVAFKRGKIVWMAPFSHIAWQDADGTIYDVEGEYVGEAFYAIPEDYCSFHMLGFLHSPAYPDTHYSTKDELIDIVKAYCEISGETYNPEIENWFTA